MIRTALAFFALTAAPASANIEVSALAIELGSVIASESLCGLTYDQAAIQAWIAANVPADAMEFPSTLAMMTQGSTMQYAALTGSGKTAHCAAIAQTARHFGFTH